MSQLGCVFASMNCARFPVRTRPGAIKGIAIHFVQDDYSTIANRQVIANEILNPYSTAQGYHYVVSNNGVGVNLINPLKQVPYFHSYTDPTWINKPNSGDGATDPDEVLIHIAVTNVPINSNPPVTTLTDAQYSELIRVLCCLIQMFPTNLSADGGRIFLADQINSDLIDLYDGSSLPSSLLSDVSDCLAGNQTIYTPVELATCCSENQASINSLTDRVVTLESLLDDAAASIVTLASRATAQEDWKASAITTIGELLTKYASLTADNFSIREYLAGLKGCLDLVCPATNLFGVIEYALSGSQHHQTVAQNFNTWISFNNKVSDTTPKSVREGALWRVDLEAGTYSMLITARLSSASYASGSKVWLEVVKCGVKTRIAEIVLGAVSQVVNISSDDNATTAWANDGQQFVITSPCSDFHIEIGTDSVGVKTLENASIVITPIIN